MALTKAGIKRMINKGRITNKFIDDLINIDDSLLNRLSSNLLRKIMSVMKRAVKKRIREFRGDTSPALEKFRRGGSEVTEKALKSMPLNQLRAQFLRHKFFLESKTSKKEKWDQMKLDIIDMMNVYGVHLTKSNYEMIWKAYGLLREMDPVVAVKEFKYEVLKRIIEIYNENGSNANSIARRVHNEIEGIYLGTKERDDDDYAETFY